MNAVQFPRLVVTGAAGQLGRALIASPLPGGFGEVVAVNRDELDITQPEAIAELLRPGDVVINCAAYTAVDRAETEPEAAYAANATGPARLAEACARVGAELIHLSTDYVFDGTGTRPYEPGDPTGPTSVYGRSKLAGEEVVLAAAPAAVVVRTAWVYTGDQRDFVATMRRLEGARDTLTVVDDQLGSPTYARDLATGLLELAARMPGRSASYGPSTSSGPGAVSPTTTSAGSVGVPGAGSAGVPGAASPGMPGVASPNAAGAVSADAAGAVTSAVPGTVPSILHATNAGQATWFELARAVFSELGADPERVRPCTSDEYPSPVRRPAYSVLSGRAWADAGLTPLRDWRAAVRAAVAGTRTERDG